jgi:hypothetical protein
MTWMTCPLRSMEQRFRNIKSHLMADCHPVGTAPCYYTCMKRCGMCKETLPDSAFSFKNKTTGMRQATCKICCRVYSKRYYLRHAIEIRPRKRARTEAQRVKNSDFVLEHLATHPCVDCGEPDVVVLEFDHVRGKKLESVSALACAGVSMQRVVAEIAKCVVRCANCHRRRTTLTLEHWRSRWTS